MTTSLHAIQVDEVRPVRPDLYHGVPVLRLHVDDPIPTPRAPERYAVLVSPDLARYLLTLNHPQNRPPKLTKVAIYARDMTSGDWAFTPESVIWSHSGVLQNGQNRLRAVIESGKPTWMMFDFGWADDLILRIDRGAVRSTSDGLHVERTPNATMVAGAIVFAARYLRTVGTPLRWGPGTLSPSEVMHAYRDAPEAWQEAVRNGRRAYDAVGGLGPCTWVAAHFLIAEARGSEDADRFMTEVADGTGEAGSATRRLADHYRRRKLTDTSSGDPREPMENIVRAVNAWATGKPVGFIRTGGAFVLSPIRKP